MTMPHEISQEDVMAFLDGELAGARADEVAAHIRQCTICQATGADVTAVSSALVGWQVGAAPVGLVAPAGRPARQLPPPAKVAMIAAACVVALVVVRFTYLGTSCVVLASCGTRPGEGGAPVSEGDDALFAAAWAKQPRVSLGVPTGNARVLIVAFVDWLCAACKARDITYQPVLRKYERTTPGAVRYVTMDWPWDASCNPQVPATFRGHEGSCVAALAVRIARDRGKADAMIAWLFENMERLAAMTPAEAAAAIKDEARRLLGLTDFDAAGAAARADLDRDLAEGVAAHITSTPTFFINGVRVPDGQALSAEHFDAAIAIELERSKARGNGS